MEKDRSHREEGESPGRRHLEHKAKNAEIGSSGESGVGVNPKGSLESQGSENSTGGSQKKRKAVVRKESAETQYDMSCQDMKVNNKSLEELGLKLPESEGFVTAAIVAPKHGSSWNAERAWHETYFFCFLPAQVQ